MAVEPHLRQFAQDNHLYLDRKGRRQARRGVRVRWTDLYGNVHDLDFVLERGGDDSQVGTPVAFIETAWRRYTKHSRNKAQEIQGAILPLVSTHQNAAPFIGVVLAGVFTDGALNQLKSLGFTVLYFSYETVIAALNRVGIDGYFDEGTPDTEFAEKVRVWDVLPQGQRLRVSNALTGINSDQTSQFVQRLAQSVTRQINLVRVIPLHGIAFECESVPEAIEFIEGYNQENGPRPVMKYEVAVRYNNGDHIEAQFFDKDSAIQFLSSYRPPQLLPGNRRR